MFTVSYLTTLQTSTQYQLEMLLASEDLIAVSVVVVKRGKLPVQILQQSTKS